MLQVIKYIIKLLKKNHNLLRNSNPIFVMHTTRNKKFVILNVQ